MFDLSVFAFPILDARVDWISGSCSVGDRADQLERDCMVWIAQEAAAGDRLSSWRFHGWTGMQAGQWRCGRSRAGVMFSKSGATWPTLAAQLAVSSDRWSRVDYAVTVLDEREVLNATWALWAEFGKENDSGTGPSKTSIVADSGGGSTVYKGSRTSARYGRVYNKYSESNGAYPPGSWRWEVEAKRHIAKGEREKWLAGNLGAEYVLGAVRSAWASWGIGVPWQSNVQPQWSREVPHQREADRLLEWLRTQVRPSVEWLREVRGEAQIADALGLTDLSVPALGARMQSGVARN